MANIIELLVSLSRKYYPLLGHPNIHKYLITGDKKLLKTLPKAQSYQYLPWEILKELGPPSKLDEVGKRLLEVCHAAKVRSFDNWLARTISEEPGGFDEFEAACGLLEGMGFSKIELAVLTIEQTMLVRKDGQITGAGKFIAGLSIAELEKAIELAEKSYYDADQATAFLGVHATEKFKRILSQRVAKKKLGEFNEHCWIGLLEANPADFVELAERAAALFSGFEALQLMAKLAEINPAKHVAEVARQAKQVLLAKDPAGNYELSYQSSHAGLILIRLALDNSREELGQFFSAPLKRTWERRYQIDRKVEVLNELIKKLGSAAVPFFEACFGNPQAELQFQALKAWINFNQPTDTPRIANFFRELLGSTESAPVSQAIRFGADWNLPLLEEDLWSALGNKSRTIRDAAAKVLAKLGDARLPKAAELWANKRADARLGAASWLRALGTPAAIAALKARLDDEENDDVRDAILLALESLGGAEGLSPAELKARIKTTLAKITGPPVKWLAPNKLPLPKLKNGKKLEAATLLYLLYRQSRVKDMRADLEAKPLYAQIDRATSGDLALAVANAFIGSKADAEDRWTLAFAALIGDDRLVPLLSRQIKDWADKMRGKLAEYGVQALALLGTDSALLAVDAMAIRYRSKNKNIGKAASEAFAEAAQARGLTVEELGDLVVPWLGFKPGEPRMVAAGKINVEVKIDGDFKLSFRDATNNKRLAKLPDSAGTAAKAEFKDLAANLKEATKSQLLRMENLMVRQFRWPVARWQELYLRHPLLLPFAWRLVWAAYLPNGQRGETFRALEDGSLTRVDDESLALPQKGNIGIVHPLELTPAERQAWIKHLADYAVISPFPQMERLVIAVKPEESVLKMGAMVENTEINALTFKGRAERLGWTRGSVCDAGMIPFYTKSFPGPGVDAFLGVENMYIGVGMEESVTLGKVFFVKHGSVKIGSYEYDEPGDDKDPRLVVFGDVPALAFSEAMGDLVKIAGKSATPEAESA